jgi:hypothetical protein
LPTYQATTILKFFAQWSSMASKWQSRPLAIEMDYLGKAPNLLATP